MHIEINKSLLFQSHRSHRHHQWRHQCCGVGRFYLLRHRIFMQQCKTTFVIPVGMTEKCGKWGGMCIKIIFFVSIHHTLTNNPSKCSSWWVLWYDKWFMQISIIIRSAGVKRSQNFANSVHTADKTRQDSLVCLCSRCELAISKHIVTRNLHVDIVRPHSKTN